MPGITNSLSSLSASGFLTSDACLALDWEKKENDIFIICSILLLSLLVLLTVPLAFVAELSLASAETALHEAVTTVNWPKLEINA